MSTEVQLRRKVIDKTGAEREGGFSASMELENLLRAIRVSWRPARHSGRSGRGTPKVFPK